MSQLIHVCVIVNMGVHEIVDTGVNNTWECVTVNIHVSVNTGMSQLIHVQMSQLIQE